MNITTKGITLQDVNTPFNFIKDFEFDESLPDHFANLKDALYVSADIIDEKINYDIEKVVIDYRINFKVYYNEDSGEKLCVHTFIKEITHKTDIKKNDGMLFLLKSYVTPPTLRVLNERKLFIKAHITGKLTMVEAKEVSTVSAEQDNCFTKGTSIITSKLSEILNDRFSIDDEITLGDGYDPISNIIDHSAFISYHETELVSSYLTVKGDIHVSFTYSSETNDGRIIHAERQIPFEKNIPIDHQADEDEHFCNIKVIVKDAVPAIDQYGEYRSIIFKFDLSVSVFALSNVHEAIISDIFAENKEEKLDKQEIEYSQIINQNDKQFIVDGSINTGEIVFSRIISSDAAIYITEQNGKSIKGEIHFDILGEGNDGISHVSATKEFEHEFEQIPIFFEIGKQEFNVNISGGNDLSYKIKFKVSALASFKSIADFIRTVDFSDVQKMDCNMIIYYPSKDETIWDVAKRYHVSPDLLASSNPSLNNEGSNEKNIVLIKF